MKQIRNLLAFSIILALSTLIFCGCEDDNSITSEEEYLFSDVGLIKFRNDYVEINDVTEVVTMDGIYLHIDSDVLIMSQRSSCSGASPGDIKDLLPGKVIEYYYYVSEVKYDATVRIIDVEKVIVYNIGCSNAPVVQ